MIARKLRQFAIAALAIGGTLLVTNLAWSKLVQYDLEKLSTASDYIVTGKVVKISSYLGKFATLGPVILSDVTIEVSQSWKGTFPSTQDARTITVQLLGGKIGDHWQLCPESPSFSMGEEVLVFARDWNGRLWTSGWLQGKYRLVKDESGKTLIEGAPDAPLPRHQEISSLEKQVKEIISSEAIRLRKLESESQQGSKTLLPLGTGGSK